MEAFLREAAGYCTAEPNWPSEIVVEYSDCALRSSIIIYQKWPAVVRHRKDHLQLSIGLTTFSAEMHPRTPLAKKPKSQLGLTAE